MDYSIEPTTPAPKFKSISLKGIAANLTSWVGVSLVKLLIVDYPLLANVTHHCVFFSILVSHRPNHLRQAEDILVHGVPSTHGEGYFRLLDMVHQRRSVCSPCCSTVCIGVDWRSCLFVPAFLVSVTFVK